MLARRLVLSAVTIIAGVLLVGLTTLQILAAPLGVPASQTGAEVGVCTWLGCKSGAVSYSQDDAGNIGGSNSCRHNSTVDGRAERSRARDRLAPG